MNAEKMEVLIESMRKLGDKITDLVRQFESETGQKVTALEVMRLEGLTKCGVFTTLKVDVHIQTNES